MYTNDQAKEQLEKLVELFSSKNLSTDYTKVYIETQDKPCKKWTFANRMLAYAQGTRDARGFNQWALVNRHVNKGSHAIYILAPRLIKLKEFDEQTKEQKEVSIINGFYGLPVFRYEDTSGSPLPVYEPKKLLPLSDVAKAWQIKITYEESLKGEYGSFNPSTNEIVLCSEDMSVFFHELAHNAHSKIEKLKTGQDIEQEIIAELTACVLCKMYNYEYAEKTYSYIASYIESKNPQAIAKACMRVLNKVEKILDMILETKEQITKQMIEVKI